MPTSTNKMVGEEVRVSRVNFIDRMLHIVLSDGREILVPYDQVKWLTWLAEATPVQRSRWKIEPGGFAIYWDELDDGIEI